MSINKIDNCIYCGIQFDSSKGEGDHIIPAQLGEFRNDVRFRRICPKCNSLIGHSEQQLLVCAPEAFFRRIVKPKIPPKRQRGTSQVKGAMGVPCPESTIKHEDHHELVRRSNDNPTNVYPIDQIVIHDENGKEYFIKLFSGMKKEDIKKQLAKMSITKYKKMWFHFDDSKGEEFESLINDTFPDFQKHRLPYREVGITPINGQITFKVNDHYFRAVTKIAFHYYLIHCHRGYRGDESIFDPIRDFIMNGGKHEHFFNQPGPKFKMPFGDLPSGGVVTPEQWCHILSAFEIKDYIIVYIQMFVGRGCVPHSYHINLAEIKQSIIVPDAVWGHVYLYDKEPQPDRYAGQVEQASITRIR